LRCDWDKKRFRMKKLILFSYLSLMLLVLGAAEKDRIAVMDVQDEDRIFNVRSIVKVTDYVFAKFQETNSFWMVPMSDRDTALEQAIEQTVKDSRKECVDEKCQLSLVAQLQANFLINTKIKKLYGSTCNITISKFDVEKRAGVQSWVEKFNCTEKGLYGAIDSFYFGASKKQGTAFQTGKMGKLEDEWTPDMAGTGERVVVYFDSNPVGATISIDGKVEGITPDVKSRLLASGKHQIKMEKEGFYTESMIVDVKKGDKINFKLLPGITINSNPQGAMVKIDGKLICQTTPCQRVVDEGQREIVLQKELYATKTQMINVQRGKDIKIDLDPDFGWLEIKSPYDGVDVFLDGKNIGKTPIPKMQITPGPHLIEPKGDCFNTVPEQIIVEKLKVKSVSLSIQEKSAAIEVYSKDEKGNDIEADVFVDGKNVGTSPGTFKIPLCSKEAIVINGDGLKYVYGLTLFEKYTSDVIAVFERNSTSSNYEDDAFDRDSYDEYSSEKKSDDDPFKNDSNSETESNSKKNNRERRTYFTTFLSMGMEASANVPFVYGVGIGAEIDLFKFKDSNFNFKKRKVLSLSFFLKLFATNDFIYLLKDNGYFRSIDLKCSAELNMYYALGFGIQFDALLGIGNISNKYLLGVNFWLVELPIYLWSKKDHFSSIRVVSFDVSYTLDGKGMQRVVVYLLNYHMRF